MKVKLKDVLFVIESAGDETRFYYNTKTEEIVMVCFDMVNGVHNPQLIEDIHESDDYLSLPDQFEIHEYEIMRAFINEKTSGNIRNQLANAIRGRGAFRRFKDKIYELGIEKDWYKYQEETYEKIAREWCERKNIEVVE